jgi:hypothetical protein
MVHIMFPKQERLVAALQQEACDIHDEEMCAYYVSGGGGLVEVEDGLHCTHHSNGRSTSSNRSHDSIGQHWTTLVKIVRRHSGAVLPDVG